MIKHILRGILAGLTTFWNATIHIVWGIATIFLLMSLINFYQIDSLVVKDLLNIATFILKNWFIFFLAFLAWEGWNKLRW